MGTRISSDTKKIAWLFSAVYFASYVMRINFAVMLVKVCADMALPKTELAIVLTCLTVAYGAGQILSGFLGDKLNPQHLLTAGLGIAVACNITMFFAQSVPPMAVIWSINGIAHALLWPPIVRLLSTHLSDEEYNYAVVRVSWGSSGATLLLYLVCPLMLYVMPWRGVMLVCAAVGIGILALWLLTGKRLLQARSPASASAENEPTVQAPAHVPVPKYVYVPVLLIVGGIIAQGMLRDGVTNWMPSYLAEAFQIPAENAIIASVIPAILSIVSFSVAAYIHRKWLKNEVFCAAVIFGISVACALVLYLTGTTLAAVIPDAVQLICTVALLALIIGAMHAINLMLITIVPKRFLKSGKVSTYSGILNACTYIGAAISTYGFAALAENLGWSATILSWIIISAAGLAVCLCAVPLWERFKRN